MISGGVAMERFFVAGGYPIRGALHIDGAKNAILPILGASLLVNGPVILHKVPELSDVHTMCNILRSLGVEIIADNKSYILDTSSLHSHAVPDNLMSEMRSSIFLMGALLGCCGAAKVSYPGGCNIGSRPIDLHLMGLRALGAEIEEKHGYIEARAARLVGTEIFLDFPSVGATENIMLAAVKAQGETVIHNAAKEPEIVDLQKFLNAAGAQVKGAGTDTLIIEGVKSLHQVEHNVVSDRIATGTFMLAAAITAGEIDLIDTNPSHLIPLLFKGKQMGLNIKYGNDFISVKAPKRLKQASQIRTSPYPGFPTDLQSPMMVAMTQAYGTGIVIEGIFDGRYNHVNELNKMGANIKVNRRTAVISGKTLLSSTLVKATDLRAGAALILAGLVADGTTIVDDIHHIDRGYSSIEKQLSSLGAHIERK